MDCTPSGRRSLVLCAFAVCLASAASTDLAGQGQSPFAIAYERGTPVSVTGVLETVVGDDFAGKRSHVLHLIRDERSGQSFELRFDGTSSRPLPSGSRVSLRGRATGSTIYIAAADGSGMTIESTAASLPATTGHRTIVIIANFRDAAVTCTPQAITDMIFTDPNWSAAKLYQDCSLGTVMLSGDVVGPLALDVSSTDPCNFNAWSVAADALATAGGANLSTYQHKFYVFPVSQCPAGGYGTVGGNPSSAWIFQCGIRGVYAHELGHNLTLDHASTPTSEYADMTDPMGMSTGMMPGLNAPHRHALGWYGPTSVRLIDEDGTYDVAPLGLDPSVAIAPQILMVRKPDSSEYYYLSYRLPVGSDQSIDGSFYQRLSVHRYRGDGSPVRTYRLAGLLDGERFVDPTNGITVTMMGHDSSRATVTVSFACAAAAPSMNFAPATASGLAGATQSYTLSLFNSDAAGCAASTFTLASAVPAGWTAAVSPSSLVVAPGGSAQATMMVTPAAGSVAASYPVSATATDSTTPQHAATASATFAVLAPADTTPPTAPSPVSAAPNVKQRRITVAWGRASDNIGVYGYRVWKNGVIADVTSSTSYVDITVTTGQNYTYAVEAYDSAGNRSPLSVSVTASLSNGKRK